MGDPGELQPLVGRDGSRHSISRGGHRTALGLIAAGSAVGAIVLLALLVMHSHTANDLVGARTLLQESSESKYSPAGRYVGPQTWDRPPGVSFAANGLPVRRYTPSGPPEAAPTLIEEYGLWAYGRYLANHAPAARRRVLAAADWLVKTQAPGGGWLYPFSWTANGWTLKAPWLSAMAQGQGMSLLERAYRLTGAQRYLRAAWAALHPLERSVAHGGVRQCFMSDCRLTFFEEYPTNPPSFTLNGFLFALIGLRDLASVAPSSKAAHDFAAGMRTLPIALPRYDVNHRAAYDLTQLTIPGEKPDLNVTYQATDIYLLRALASTKLASPILRKFAQRWAGLFTEDASP